MKLYRGTKEKYKPFTREIKKDLEKGWEEILKKREAGDLSFSKETESSVPSLSKLQKLSRQYFTDNKEIAKKYAKENKGSLIEINIPIKEILDNFIIEFQNYSKRKESFEIVYLIDSRRLLKNKNKWELTVTDF